MTRDDIISRLGWLGLRHLDELPDSLLSRIEKLVADAEAAEREACAKVCDDASRLFCDSGHIGVCLTNAGAIRARSEK